MLHPEGWNLSRHLVVVVTYPLTADMPNDAVGHLQYTYLVDELVLVDDSPHYLLPSAYCDRPSEGRAAGISPALSFWEVMSGGLNVQLTW